VHSRYFYILILALFVIADRKFLDAWCDETSVGLKRRFVSGGVCCLFSFDRVVRGAALTTGPIVDQLDLSQSTSDLWRKSRPHTPLHSW
jgi:hypothetical protein